MLTLTHTIIGGAIGTQVDSPYAAFALGVLAHFVFDKIPHFWPKSKKGKSYVMILDGVFTLITFIILIIFFPNRPSIIWGAIGGGVVDVVLVLTPFFKTKVGQWHTNRQPHKEFPIFFATDIAIMALGILVIILFGAGR